LPAAVARVPWFWYAESTVPLSGDFRETHFADLIRSCEVSKESVEVTVWFGPSTGEPDGLFHFERGNLVSARLVGLQGDEALREALRLRKGTFTVAPWVKQPACHSKQEPADRSVIEVPARSGGKGRPAAEGGDLRRPARKSITGIVALAVGGVVALAIGTVVFLLLSPPGRFGAQRTDQAMQQMLSPPVARPVSAAEIVLGMASPFTGANRELGRAMKAGIEAALAEVNAAGGVHGRKLRLVALDDGYEPSRTGPVMKQLVEGERVLAVIGNVGTPTATVAVPYCIERSVVFFGALSGGDLLRRHPPDRVVFNFRPSYAEETAAAVGYLVGERRLLPSRVAVFAQEDEFGESGWRGAADELQRRGADLARIVRVGYRRNTADVSAAVARIEEHAREIDAVVMVATYKAAATFIRKLRDAGLPVFTTNVSPVDANALAEELVTAGRRYTEGVVVTQVVPVPSSRAAAILPFQEAMARYGGGERAGFLALEGWVAGHVLAEGLRRAGADVDTERLVGALEQIRELDLGIGTRISFGPQEHQGSHKVWGTMLQPDGSWRQIALE